MIFLHGITYLIHRLLYTELHVTPLAEGRRWTNQTSFTATIPLKTLVKETREECINVTLWELQASGTVGLNPPHLLTVHIMQGSSCTPKKVNTFVVSLFSSSFALHLDGKRKSEAGTNNGVRSAGEQSTELVAATQLQTLEASFRSQTSETTRFFAFIF